MTLHLIKNPTSALPQQILTAKPAAQAGPTTIVLLPPADSIPPAFPRESTYYVKEHASPMESHALSYARLVEMIFQADKVIAW